MDNLNSKPIKTEGKPKNKRGIKILFIVVLILIILGGIGYGVLYILKKKEIYRPKEDAVSRELPANAATTRLNLPVSFSSLKIGKNSGLGGLGISTNDSNTTDYVTFDINSGTEIQSMAAGQVKKINKIADDNFEVIIDFSYGLTGKYSKLKEVSVKEGENVREGQVIGKGSVGNQQGSDAVVFSLADENRQVGKKSDFSNGVIVAPLDYLKPDVKARVLEKYQ